MPDEISHKGTDPKEVPETFQKKDSYCFIVIP